jgi:exodeoxyribonuclease VII large subunit
MTFSLELPVLTVSAFTQSVRLLLENNFRAVSVQGEVSNSKLQTSGHFYFSLKDQNAQVSAVIFKGQLGEGTRLPKDGDQLIIKGAVNVYPPSGKYQIIVRTFEVAGLGVLLQKLEELKAKLKQKGYFALDRKKALPKFPHTIGVVTSPTGAVIQDIVHVLTRRFSGVRLLLNPVKVQGEGAAQEIAKAIDYFNAKELVDVMIVGRGGGSMEDLWAFNEEIVADAIFRSRIPIISAVGHETDVCLADFVADVRAPTPSAAAEIVIAAKAEQLKTVIHFERAIRQSLTHLLKQRKEALRNVAKNPFLASPATYLGIKMQQLDEIKTGLGLEMKAFCLSFRQKLALLTKENQTLQPLTKVHRLQDRFRFITSSLDHLCQNLLEEKAQRLEHLKAVLLALHPHHILEKGYAIVFSEKSGSIIKSVHSVEENDKIRLQLADGSLFANIKGKSNE